MRDVLGEIDGWLEAGEEIALATVIETWGSAPRGVGAKMVFTRSTRIAGSVSGGCVEGAVLDSGAALFERASPQLLRFGVTDDVAWEVGLACGGTISVFVELLDRKLYTVQRRLLAGDSPFAVATVVAGQPQFLGKKLVFTGQETFGEVIQPIRAALLDAAGNALVAGRSMTVELSPSGQPEPLTVFVEIIQPAPTLIMVGGVHIAIALAMLARTVGYHTVVVDPRRAFGSEERFSHADRLIQAWPEEAFRELALTPFSAIAILTHDPKIDDAAIKAALQGQPFYIGALGSKKTHEARRGRLLDAGFMPEQIERIHAPIGLDIGAANPEEIALSIMAEIVAADRTRNRQW